MNKNYRLLNPDELIAETDEIFFGGNEKGVIAGSAWAGIITGRLKVRREIVPLTSDTTEKNYRLLGQNEAIRHTDELFHVVNEEWMTAGFSREGDTVGDRIVRREVPPTPTEPSLDIVELALCESPFILPRPNQLYKYYVGEGCEKCETIANVYKQLGL